MFLVAVELLESLDAQQAAVGAHQVVALLADPFGDGLVVAFAAADERGAEIKVLRLFRLGRGKDLVEQLAELGGREWRDGPAGLGMVLHAELGVEQAQVLRDLGDRGDGGLAGASGDALLDGDGWRDAAEAIDVGPRQLFDELPRVG